MDKEALLRKALQEGIQDIEVFERQSKCTTIAVFEQQVDSFKKSQCNSMNIRGIYQGKMGSCYIEEDVDTVLPFIITAIKQNASSITSDDEVEIYAGEAMYPVVEYSENKCLLTSVEDKIDFLKQLEAKLLQYDARIVQVMDVKYQDIESGVQIDNSKGVHIAHDESYSVLIASVLASDGNDQKSAYEVVTLRDFNSFHMECFVASLCKKAIDQLHGEQVDSQSYPVIIEKEAMASLLKSVSGLFNGENAHKGISLLKDKLGECIFDSKITIVDQPLMKDGVNSYPFDDEGVACYEKVLVENGILRTYLHNLKSAKLMNCTSTGNGFDGGISFSNMSIKEGTTSFEQLVNMMNTGIIIKEVNGLHAGLNALTTEFSLQASGFYVENGAIIKPVNLITIAGNFLEMMKDITAIGNDLKFQLSGIGSPSILFPSMAISGK